MPPSEEAKLALTQYVAKQRQLAKDARKQRKAELQAIAELKARRQQQADRIRDGHRPSPTVQGPAPVSPANPGSRVRVADLHAHETRFDSRSIALESRGSDRAVDNLGFGRSWKTGVFPDDRNE